MPFLRNVFMKILSRNEKFLNLKVIQFIYLKSFPIAWGLNFNPHQKLLKKR